MTSSLRPASSESKEAKTSPSISIYLDSYVNDLISSIASFKRGDKSAYIAECEAKLGLAVKFLPYCQNQLLLLEILDSHCNVYLSIGDLEKFKQLKHILFNSFVTHACKHFVSTKKFGETYLNTLINRIKNLKADETAIGEQLFDLAKQLINKKLCTTPHEKIYELHKAMCLMYENGQHWEQCIQWCDDLLKQCDTVALQVNKPKVSIHRLRAEAYEIQCKAFFSLALKSSPPKKKLLNKAIIANQGVIACRTEYKKSNSILDINVLIIVYERHELILKMAGIDNTWVPGRVKALNTEKEKLMKQHRNSQKPQDVVAPQTEQKTISETPLETLPQTIPYEAKEDLHAALQAFEANQFELVIKYTDSVIKNAPCLIAHRLRCYAYLQLREYENAAREATTIIDKYPHDKIAGLQFRGIARSKLSKQTEAYGDLLSSIRLDNNNDTLQYSVRHEEIFTALISCESKYKSSSPEVAKHQLILEAFKHLEEGLQLTVSNPERAKILLEQAENELTHAIQLNATSLLDCESELFYARSLARHHNNNLQDALNDLDIAIWICKNKMSVAILSRESRSELQSKLNKYLVLYRNIAYYIPPETQFGFTEPTFFDPTKYSLQRLKRSGVPTGDLLTTIQLHKTAATTLTILKQAHFPLPLAGGNIVRDPLMKRDIVRYKKDGKQEIDIDLAIGFIIAGDFEEIQKIIQQHSLEEILKIYPDLTKFMFQWLQNELPQFTIEQSYLPEVFKIKKLSTPTEVITIKLSKYLACVFDSKTNKKIFVYPDPVFFEALSRDCYHSAGFANPHGEIIIPLIDTINAFRNKKTGLIDKRLLLEFEAKAKGAEAYKEYKQLLTKLTPERLCLYECNKRIIRALAAVANGFTLHQKTSFALTASADLLRNRNGKERPAHDIRTINICLQEKIFSLREALIIFLKAVDLKIAGALFPKLMEMVRQHNLQAKLEHILKTEARSEYIYASFIILENFPFFSKIQIDKLDNITLQNIVGKSIRENPFYDDWFAYYQNAETLGSTPRREIFKICLMKLFPPAITAEAKQKQSCHVAKSMFRISSQLHAHPKQPDPRPRSRSLPW